MLNKKFMMLRQQTFIYDSNCSPAGKPYAVKDYGYEIVKTLLYQFWHERNYYLCRQ